MKNVGLWIITLLFVGFVVIGGIDVYREYTNSHQDTITIDSVVVDTIVDTVYTDDTIYIYK